MARERRRGRKNGDHSLIGNWRIAEMELWDAEFIDMLEPGYIQFDADGGGHFIFGAVQGGPDCDYGQASVHFTWAGSDEMDETSGDRGAELEDDGTLTGEIRFHLGDESSFRARRWQIFRSLLGCALMTLVMRPLPSQVDVERHSPLARLCTFLGLPRARSDAELLSLVERGFPTASVEVLAARLPADAVYKLLISRSALNRRRRLGGHLTYEESDRALRVARVTLHAIDVFGDPTKATAWLTAPKAMLGGRTPLSVLMTESGGRFVEGMLYRIDHGISA